MENVYHIDETNIEETLFGLLDNNEQLKQKIYYDNLYGFVSELNDLEWNNL